MPQKKQSSLSELRVGFLVAPEHVAVKTPTPFTEPPLTPSRIGST